MIDIQNKAGDLRHLHARQSTRGYFFVEEHREGKAETDGGLLAVLRDAYPPGLEDTG